MLIVLFLAFGVGAIPGSKEKFKKKEEKSEEKKK